MTRMAPLIVRSHVGILGAASSLTGSGAPHVARQFACSPLVLGMWSRSGWALPYLPPLPLHGPFRLRGASTLSRAHCRQRQECHLLHLRRASSGTAVVHPTLRALY